ncbi:MAG TPA: M28 family peptidase [Terriglobia bacterium]
MRRRWRPLAATWVVVLTLSWPARAQRSPFLPEDIDQKLTNEISGDIAFDNLRSLVLYHAPEGESEGFQDEARWVADRARTYGIENVHFIDLPSWGDSSGQPLPGWTLKGGELWLISPVTVKLGDVRETPTSVADYSPTADLTADLVDVGEGTDDADYEGKDVKGKIVLAYGPPAAIEQIACAQHGAIGIVSYYSTRTDPWTDHPDQVAWLQSGPALSSAPVFVVSPRTGLALARWMSGRASTYIFAPPPPASPPGPFRVHLTVQADVAKPGRQGMVEGFIRGTTDHGHAIVLTAHLQEEKTSANDDRSGCANLLEVGRALEAMIKDGRLPRPKRDIRFWWTNEIDAELEYFAEHPEERGRILADINQDMVGARQSIGGRVQQVSLTPYSRWSLVDDVVTSIVESLAKGNNAYLPAWQAGNLAPFSQPIFAHIGSREPYHIEVVPYFDDTDHQVFNIGAIGIPGVDFTNWPDEYIHSSDDDLWQIDPTQLQRNADAVAASALYLANLSEPDGAVLAGVVASRARVRISQDLAAAIASLSQAPPAQRDASYVDALNLLDQAEAREEQALHSVEPYTSPEIHKLLTRLIEDLKLTEVNHKQRLEEWYGALVGHGFSAPAPTDLEKSAAAEVPNNVEPLGDYLHRAAALAGPTTLHPVMEAEALNYVDGHRSVLDIYDAVRAESLSAGEWYYGKVTLADITDLFQSAQKAGAVEIANRGHTAH